MDSRIPPLSYAPDGLYESDIDTLIAEYFPVDAPYTSSDQVAANRHVRRLSRQTISGALRVRPVESDRSNAEAA